MKNKEKYAKEIVEIACDGHDIAVNKNTGKPESCKFLNCNECLFSGHGNQSCNDVTREWAESEYIEKPVISKKDKAFLEYIDKKFDYLARTHCGNICIFITEPRKSQKIWTSGYLFSSLGSLNIDFPMVKWEDDKPWLIEDLKKLEVVEEYEK